VGTGGHLQRSSHFFLPRPAVKTDRGKQSKLPPKRTVQIVKTSTFSRLAICMSLAIACVAAVWLVSAAPVTTPSNTVGPRSTALASITEPAPSGYRSWDDFWNAQNQLLAGAEQIRGAGQDNSGFLSGYADLSIDNQLHQIDLYWKGTIPSVVRAAVASVDARVPVKVHQAAYDWHELETAAQALLNPESGTVQLSNGQALNAQNVVATQPATGGSGLNISYFDPSRSPQNAATESRGEPLETALTAAAPLVNVGLVNVRVNVTNTTDAPDSTNLSRGDPPLHGGRAFLRGTNACSTAFSIKDSGHKLRELTAAHCAHKGDKINTSLGKPFGVTTTSNTKQDVAIFDNSRDTSRAPWTNEVEQGTHYLNPDGATSTATLSAREPVNGQFICISPAYSGGSCGIHITHPGTFYKPRNSEPIGPVFQAFSNSENIVGPGDSGGPVFDSITIQDTINALGVISGKVGTPTTDCKGVRSGRTCARGMYFVGIQEAFHALGLTL
jgi:hypothetical protein